ncbi:PREDICTED: microsomal glutathione S-transferase 3 [Camelina sativa]|uniref:Microsomal glutathione S-transferase 3 n=1 Tax=Camelina sativa TaxID=90675 RepID=A0ABM0U466_CAMSA|nr:PREDICTED: microsomal glutathione S-transferase 3 [Camelina sativa]
MAITEFLPKEYGYVVIVVVLYCFLNFWMSFQVGGARKRYKVFYPSLYAIESENKDAKLFNCVQRGHQNSLEMMPMYFLLMILGGMKHPCICACLGLLYNVSRFFYFKGYSTGDPKNRLTIGKYGFLAMLGLAVCTISFAITLLRGQA